MENQTELKWFQKPTGVIILLIFFFPVGLYLMWKNDLWTKQTRWIVTAMIAVVIVANAGKNNDGLSSSSKYDKPKLCDCQNYWWKDIEDAMYYGKTEPSDFVNECGKFYTVEEITNANCGLTKYDPNFKAK
jgi:hypothetical protein